MQTVLPKMSKQPPHQIRATLSKLPNLQIRPLRQQMLKQELDKTATMRAMMQKAMKR